MSSLHNSTDLSLIFHSLRQRLGRYLPESSERAQVILQSSAVMQASYATLKNISYAFLSKELGINDFSNMLATRITYIESAMIAFVTAICNLAFGLLYLALSVTTLGLSSSLNFAVRKHWHHVTYAFAAMGVSLVGLVAPYYGAGLNIYLLYATLNMMKKCYGHDVHLFERPLLNELQDITRNYAPIVYNYTREKVKNDLRFQEILKPSLEYIERKIHTAHRMDDLVNLVFEVRNQWPRVGFEDQKFAEADKKNKGSRAIHKYYE